MSPTRRIAAVAITAAISIGSVSMPAMAATSKHWTSAQCQTWAKSFNKRNPHPSTTRLAEGNKVLKGQGCSVRVK